MIEVTIKLDEFEYEVIKNHHPFDDSIVEGAVINGIIEQIKSKEKNDVKNKDKNNSKRRESIR